MNLKILREKLSAHTQTKITVLFVLIAFVVFLSRGKAGNDNWSDEVFFAEFISLCATSLLLVLLIRYLPKKRLALPWFLATLATVAIIAYVAGVGMIQAPSFEYLITHVPSFGIFSLRFFGLLATAPEGESTRAALLDTQLAMATGFILGLFLLNQQTQKERKYPAR